MTRWHYTITEQGDIIKHVSPHEPAWQRGGANLRRAEYVHAYATSRLWEHNPPANPLLWLTLSRISHLESAYHVERLYYPLLEAAG